MFCANPYVAPEVAGPRKCLPLIRIPPLEHGSCIMHIRTSLVVVLNGCLATRHLSSLIISYAVTLPFNLNLNYKVVNVFRYDFVSALMFVSMWSYSISLLLCHRLLRVTKWPGLVGFEVGYKVNAFFQRRLSLATNARVVLVMFIFNSKTLFRLDGSSTTQNTLHFPSTFSACIRSNCVYFKIRKLIKQTLKVKKLAGKNATAIGVKLTISTQNRIC